MCEVTRKAVAALLAADETATEDERRRVALALSGDYAALTLRDAAERLGVSVPTVYALVRAGKIERLADGRISGLSIERYFAGVSAKAKGGRAA